MAARRVKNRLRIARTGCPGCGPDRSGHAAAQVLAVLEAAVGGPLPIRIQCWDGSVAGALAVPASLIFRDPRALGRLLWAPSELGLVRAYVSGDLDFEGNISAVLDLPDVISRTARQRGVGLTPRERLRTLATARRLGPSDRLPASRGRDPIPARATAQQGT